MRDLLRDEELLAQVLRRKLLRSIVRAVNVLDACGRGKDIDSEALRAATVLARLVPRFVTAPQPEARNNPFDAPEWWTVEKRIGLETFGRYDSREHAAKMWRCVFDKNGAREGLFQTREEAAEYGRMRFDNYDTLGTERRRRFHAGERDLYVYRP